MSPIQHISTATFPPVRFRDVVGAGWPEVEAAVAHARKVFAGRVIWHVSSTAKGGGVVELLTSLLAYAKGAGVENRWVVIDAPSEFFRITKRIHNNLHGFPGDGGELGQSEREIYESVAAANANELVELIDSNDVVFLHDPQTAGMAANLHSSGATVVWRCHIGLDRPNENARRAWGFLRPYVEQAQAYVFSRKEFVWEGMESPNIWIVPPSVDVFAPKNQDLDPATVDAILAVAGLKEDGDYRGEALFRSWDGTPRRVDRHAEVIGGLIPRGASVVTQVSRWDRLKDHAGVMRCFAEHCENPDIHLLLAGPETGAVADDPEAGEVYAELIALRESLSPERAGRVHIVSLPMADVEENAAIVNAIQASSTVVVQKSLAEGFGLTVSEAMWKRTPVVASRRGGIQDQIVDGESGFLVDDPSDLATFAAVIDRLIANPEEARRIGEAGRDRVREKFLGTRHLIQYLRLIEALND